MSQPSGLDVRWPLGLMFVLIGALLLAYGLLYTPEVVAGAPSRQPHIVNVGWGAIMCVFGAAVLYLARRGSQKNQP